MTREKKLGELIALIQALAPDHNCADVARWAQSLMDGAVIEKAAEHGLRRRKGTARALDELRELNKGAIALLEKIDALGTEAAHVLERGLRVQGAGLDTWRTMESIAALANATRAAHSMIDECPPTLPSPRRAPEYAATAIAQDAARIYKHLTGLPASVTSGSDGRDGGPFVAFLGKLFVILGIDASPAARARALMENCRQKSR